MNPIRFDPVTLRALQDFAREDAVLSLFWGRKLLKLEKTVDGTQKLALVFQKDLKMTLWDNIKAFLEVGEYNLAPIAQYLERSGLFQHIPALEKEKQESIKQAALKFNHKIQKHNGGWFSARIKPLRIAIFGQSEVAPTENRTGPIDHLDSNTAKENRPGFIDHLDYNTTSAAAQPQSSATSLKSTLCSSLELQELLSAICQTRVAATQDVIGNWKKSLSEIEKRENQKKRPDTEGQAFDEDKQYLANLIRAFELSLQGTLLFNRKEHYVIDEQGVMKQPGFGDCIYETFRSWVDLQGGAAKYAAQVAIGQPKEPRYSVGELRELAAGFLETNLSKDNGLAALVMNDIIEMNEQQQERFHDWCQNCLVEVEERLLGQLRGQPIRQFFSDLKKEWQKLSDEELAGRIKAAPVPAEVQMPLKDFLEAFRKQKEELQGKMMPLDDRQEAFRRYIAATRQARFWGSPVTIYVFSRLFHCSVKVSSQKKGEARKDLAYFAEIIPPPAAPISAIHIDFVDSNHYNLIP